MWTVCRGTVDFQSLLGWPNRTPDDYNYFNSMGAMQNLSCPADLYPVGVAARSACFQLTDFRVPAPADHAPHSLHAANIILECSLYVIPEVAASHRPVLTAVL